MNARPTAGTAAQRENMTLPLVICALSAIGVITVCSKSSFLYPFNDWVDANCFFTVGKSMMNGIVPYRDLFEQKGPLLYLLHGLAWLLSHDTFLGVYVLEIAACFFFLFYSYRIMRLYAGAGIVYTVPVLAMLCCTSVAFRHGDSAEELCLPLLAASLWIFLRTADDPNDLSRKDALLIGVLAGCVFWIKFTLIGPYIGWFIVFALTAIRRGATKKLWRTTGCIAGGVILVTLPFALYFGVHHAVRDWLTVYLWDNLFVYSAHTEAGGGLLLNLRQGLESFRTRNGGVFYLCLAGLAFAAAFREKHITRYVPFMLLVTFLVVYAGGRSYAYYSDVLNVFAIFGLICVYRLLVYVVPRSSAPRRTQPAVACLLTAACVALALYLTPNRYLMGTAREELPQYQFAGIIHQSENPTLLNYGFLDGGFYTAANLLPNCKAFCKLNIDLPEMLEMQERYVRDGLCEFVVTRGKEDFDRYTCVAESAFFLEGEVRTYYLYQKNSLPS